MKRERKLIGNKKLGKTEIPGVYKVSEGVLINKDNEALMNYKKRKKALREKDMKINNLESKVDTISKELEQIKELLTKMVEK